MDRQRFAEVVEGNEREIRRFCTTLVGDPEVGRDLAQEVFLRLWEARERYHERGQSRALLYTIARNLCRSYLRKRTVRKWITFDHDAPDSNPTVEDEMVTGEQRELVQWALRRLPERFRTPLTLRYVEGVDYDTIAEVIGRTPSAARSRVHYGLKKMADIIRRERER